MSRSPLIVEVESKHMKKKVPLFNIGDTVRVQTRIVEGEKERIQAFTGTVVAKKGCGISETFTVYRTAYGSSMERVFMLHSPRVADVEVMRAGKVRRAKLYYIRGLSGKATKIREQYVGSTAAAARPAEEVVAVAATDNQ